MDIAALINNLQTMPFVVSSLSFALGVGMVWSVSRIVQSRKIQTAIITCNIGIVVLCATYVIPLPENDILRGHYDYPPYYWYFLLWTLFTFIGLMVGYYIVYKEHSTREPRRGW